jgi:hypothetical protein
MPARNPGKTAFVVILGLAALTGILLYIFAGVAMPRSGIETPAYDQGLPPPTIPSDTSGQENETVAAEQTPGR